MPELKDWDELEAFSRKVPRYCEECGLSSFEVVKAEHHYQSPMAIEQKQRGSYAGFHSDSTQFYLLRCAGCSRGALLEVHKVRRALASRPYPTKEGTQVKEVIGKFYPRLAKYLPLPPATPADILAEFREAEDCIGAGACRAASALFRSVLEKTLEANGFKESSLKKSIDAACADGLLTETMKSKAHNEIRVLGNDVVHDAWRAVPEQEVESSRTYSQRVIEAFYDDRPTAEGQLKAKSRIP